MVTAILIGFQYQKNKLEGAIIDLYNAYEWCKSFTDRIYIICDFEEIDTEVIKDAIARRLVTDSIVNFIRRDRLRIVVSDRDSLIDTLYQLDFVDDKLIVYYSGHGEYKSVVTPDHKTVEFNFFRELILIGCLEFQEIFWIMDCCNPNGFNLPFILDNDSFHLSKGEINCVTQPILLITSSNSQEKSMATSNGSIFSRNLFKILSKNDGNRNLQRIRRELMSSIRKVYTSTEQSVSIYSSYVMDPVLWMWIGGLTDIASNISMSTLVVRHPETTR